MVVRTEKTRKEICCFSSLALKNTKSVNIKLTILANRIMLSIIIFKLNLFFHYTTKQKSGVISHLLRINYYRIIFQRKVRAQIIRLNSPTDIPIIANIFCQPELLDLREKLR